MLSLTGSMKYLYCEGNVSFHYKWDGLESYIKYVLKEDPRSGTVSYTHLTLPTIVPV